MVGGQNIGKYPGFNGQFYAIDFNKGDGAFKENFKDIKLEVLPVFLKNRLVKKLVQGDSVTITEKDEKVVGGGVESSFPEEYSVAGWFKFITSAD